MTNYTFHLSLPTNKNLKIRLFYEDLLGCRIIKDNPSGLAFDFFGGLVNLSYIDDFMLPSFPLEKLSIDDHMVEFPSHHFGAILPRKIWHQLSKKLLEANREFIISPNMVDEGTDKEQGFMMLRDPMGYAIELKYLAQGYQVEKVCRFGIRERK